jgi:hypothetical protein
MQSGMPVSFVSVWFVASLSVKDAVWLGINFGWGIRGDFVCGSYFVSTLLSCW